MGKASPERAQGRIPELDGLRGIAIMLVVVWHYVIVTSPDPLTVGLLTWSGVDLFFVLSGFLIGGILMDSRESPLYYSSFYVRRFYRIVPLYLVILMFAFLGASLTDSFMFEGQLHPLAYLTFTQNIWMSTLGTYGSSFTSVTWSLAVEEQFYLVLPFLLRKISRKQIPLVMAMLIITAPLLRFVLFVVRGHAPLASYVFSGCRADALALGVLAAWLIRNEHYWQMLVRNRHWMSSALVVLAAGVVGMNYVEWQLMSLEMTTVGFTWIALFYFAVLVLTLIYKPAFLRAPLLTAPGMLAYGIYLFHQPVQGIVFSAVGLQPTFSSVFDGALQFAALCGTLVLAKVSWEYFEKPLVLKGRHYTEEAPPQVRVPMQVP